MNYSSIMLMCLCVYSIFIKMVVSQYIYPDLCIVVHKFKKPSEYHYIS